MRCIPCRRSADSLAGWPFLQDRHGDRNVGAEITERANYKNESRHPSTESLDNAAQAYEPSDGPEVS